jgi:hypothetical protein
MASRIARRAILHAPDRFPAGAKEDMLEVCDRLDALCATGGAAMAVMRPLYERAKAWRGTPAGEAAEALYWAVDATASAEAANDFPADETCRRDAREAFAAAGNADGLSPLQVMTFLAADMDQLRFACAEAGVGAYDPLGPSVMGRLAPVRPPSRKGDAEGR